MSIVENVLFGAIASIIASAICAFAMQLYRLRAKQKIDYCINNAILAFYAFESANKFGYYDIAIAQADVVLNEINNINQNIAVLTYFPTKKRLFYTFMNNVSRFMAVAKSVTLGYSEETEKQERCNRIQRYLNYHTVANKSWILVNLRMMRNLNDTRTLRKAFSKDRFEMTDDELVQLYEQLIEVNSFDTGAYINNFELRASGYTKDKYVRKIRKIVKVGGTN